MGLFFYLKINERSIKHILDDEVKQLLTIGRKRTDQHKVTEFDSCFFCLGVFVLGIEGRAV
ncbi:hypothetical protein V3595_22305 [Bacillus sp. CFBP9009]